MGTHEGQLPDRLFAEEGQQLRDMIPGVLFQRPVNQIRHERVVDILIVLDQPTDDSQARLHIQPLGRRGQLCPDLRMRFGPCALGQSLAQ